MGGNNPKFGVCMQLGMAMCSAPFLGHCDLVDLGRLHVYLVSRII